MRSVKHFIGQKPYCILRLKTREIPEQLSQKVQEMMDYDGDYHVLKNNCLHFALRLLGVGKFFFFFTSHAQSSLMIEVVNEDVFFLSAVAIKATCIQVC